MTTLTGSPAGPRPDPAPGSAWDSQRLFDLISAVSPLRIISRCGPSTFEAIASLERFSIARGWLNAMQPDFHWHLDLGGLGWVRSRDQIHSRSGRRVMFLELAASAEQAPFLLVYLYRPKGAEFTPEQEARFAEAHADLANGLRLEKTS
ncbi:MAG: hypothetical protein ACQGVK_00420 [Myxococcota bacterium]